MTATSDKAPKLSAAAAAASRLGGKGTPRRKVKKGGPAKTTGGVNSSLFQENDKKIANAMKKINGQVIPGIEQVNLFKDDGNIIHFAKPTGTLPNHASSCALHANLCFLLVQAAVGCNTFCISGFSEEKGLAEMVPGILNQLGSDSIANLRRIAESFQSRGAAAGASQATDEDDEEVPELVENFQTQVTTADD